MATASRSARRRLRRAKAKKSAKEENQRDSRKDKDGNSNGSVVKQEQTQRSEWSQQPSKNWSRASKSTESIKAANGAENGNDMKEATPAKKNTVKEETPEKAQGTAPAGAVPVSSPKKRKRGNNSPEPDREETTKQKADLSKVTDKKDHREMPFITPKSSAKKHEKDSKEWEPENAPGALKDKDNIASKEERLKAQKQERKEQKKAKVAKKQKIEERAKKDHETMIEVKSKLRMEKLIEKQKAQAKSPYKVLSMGVKYQDVIVGKGPAAQHRTKVHVKYVLRSESFQSGKILDSSNNFGFRLGRGEVIEGWDVGVCGMRQGGRRRLVVPPQAGYGMQDIGAGKGGTLYFDITLLSCQHAK